MKLKLIQFKDGLFCPHCSGTKIVLFGKRKNIQRYHCKNCGKYFNDLTGTPMAYSKKLDKWPALSRAMQKGLSIRETAKKLDISIDTSFRWRRRLLTGLVNYRRKVELSGIVEIDETIFRRSEKGSRKLSRKPRKRGSENYKRSK